MKGLAFRKLSRTSSHRSSLLRNLVTSLIQHERISTTVAKAKEAQREAEKLITLGKRIQNGSSQAKYTAISKIYSPETTLPILSQLSQRYSTRPGGYTRLHLHGHRKGDHAPRALLELVDGPKDMKIEITARAMARETFLWEKEQNRLQSLGLKNDLDQSNNPLSLRESSGAQTINENENQDQTAKATETQSEVSTSTTHSEETNQEDEYSKGLQSLAKDTRFGALTRKAIQQISAFKGIENLEKLTRMASDHLNRLKAIEALEKGPSIPSSSSKTPDKERLTELMKSGNGPRGINNSKSLDEKLESLQFGSVTLPGREKKLKAGQTSDQDHYRFGGNLKSLRKRHLVGGDRGRKSVLKVARGVFVKRQWRGSNELLIGQSQREKELNH